MDLTDIEELTDKLLEALADEQSSERDLRIVATRLQGLAHASQVKSNAVLRKTLDDAVVAVQPAQGVCGKKSRSVWTGERMAPQTCRIQAGHSGYHKSAQGVEWTEGEDMRTCGFRWSWGVGADGSHFEICTEPAKHTGDHRNSVTGIAHVPTKPIADRLHELTSNWRSSADSYESVAREGSTEEAFAVQLRACAGDLEAVLMEGGI